MLISLWTKIKKFIEIIHKKCIIKVVNKKVINTILSINLYIITHSSAKGGEILALEAIKEIKKAESEADEMIKSANVEAKDILQKATIEATDNYNKVLAEAKDKCNSIINDAVEAGNKEAEPILLKGKQEAQDIYNIEEDRKNNAVKLVIERIVKIHGNS